MLKDVNKNESNTVISNTIPEDKWIKLFGTLEADLHNTETDYFLTYEGELIMKEQLEEVLKRTKIEEK